MNVKTHDDCLKQFENFKFRKIQARYIIYNIVNEEIVVERIGEKKESWEDFMEILPEN